METSMSSLCPGQQGTILCLTETGPMRRRLLDLGFVPGAPVECLFRGGWGEPTAYGIRGAVIALRRADASGVRVKTA